MQIGLLFGGWLLAVSCTLTLAGPLIIDDAKLKEKLAAIDPKKNQSPFWKLPPMSGLFSWDKALCVLQSFRITRNLFASPSFQFCLNNCKTLANWHSGFTGGKCSDTSNQLAMSVCECEFHPSATVNGNPAEVKHVLLSEASDVGHNDEKDALRQKLEQSEAAREALAGEKTKAEDAIDKAIKETEEQSAHTWKAFLKSVQEKHENELAKELEAKNVLNDQASNLARELQKDKKALTIANAREIQRVMRLKKAMAGRNLKKLELDEAHQEEIDAISAKLKAQEESFQIKLTAETAKQKEEMQKAFEELQKKKTEETINAFMKQMDVINAAHASFMQAELKKRDDELENVKSQLDAANAVTDDQVKQFKTLDEKTKTEKEVMLVLLQNAADRMKVYKQELEKKRDEDALIYDKKTKNEIEQEVHDIEEKVDEAVPEITVASLTKAK